MHSRSPVLIGVVVVAVLVGLGVFLLAHTGSGEPPAAAPPPSPSATPSATEGTPTTAPDPSAVLADQSTVVLRVRVAGCSGCQLTAIASDASAGERTWKATVTGGAAQLEIPTPNTLGLAFFLQGEKDGNDTPARTLTALQPDGATPGDEVSAAQIANANTTGYCWAGTTLDVAVLQFQAQAKGGHVDRAWANPALPTLVPTVSLSGKPDAPAKLACAAQS